MQQGISPARYTGRMVAGLLALLVGAAPAAFAQTATPPAKPAEKKAAPKTAPKAAHPVQPPAQAPPQTAEQAPPGQGAQQPQLMYSPWIKICNKNETDPNAKQVCVTAKDGRLENGMPVAAVALIEPQGEQKEAMRGTAAVGMQLAHRTRLNVHQE